MKIYLRFVKFITVIVNLIAKFVSYCEQMSHQINSTLNDHKSENSQFKTNKEEQEIEIKHFDKHRINNIELIIVKIISNKKQRIFYERDMII